MGNSPDPVHRPDCLRVGKLPQVGSAIGKSIRNFKKAQSGEDEEEEKLKTQAIKKAE